MQKLGISLTAIIVALICGSFAIFANMLALVMLGQINLKLPEKERMHWAAWGMRIGKQHRELYPQSKLGYLFNACIALTLVCFLILLRVWVFA